MGDFARLIISAEEQLKQRWQESICHLRAVTNQIQEAKDQKELDEILKRNYRDEFRSQNIV